MDKTLPFGEVVSRLRWARSLTQAGLAADLEKSLAFVQRIEKKKSIDELPVIRPANFIRLASRLGVRPDDLRHLWSESEFQKIEERVRTLAEDAAIAEAVRQSLNSTAQKLADWEDYKKKAGLENEKDSGEWDVDVKSVQPVARIPTFDLAVAAGPWTEVTEVGQLHDPRQIEAGLFRIRIQGDSMEGEGGYDDGALVEFECLREGGAAGDGHRLEEGEDYYVQVGDEATFKRLEQIGKETLIFRAINRRKYPKPITVRKDEIVRMAHAEFTMRKCGKRKN